LRRQSRMWAYGWSGAGYLRLTLSMHLRVMSLLYIRTTHLTD
jgi:hypothetical protein